MATCAPQIDETNQTERVRALNDLARLGQNANARFVGGSGGLTGTTKRANALGV